jgi:hypothetical protein
LDDWGEVFKDDESLTRFYGFNGCENMVTYWEGFFPYDPNANYSIEVYPQLNPKHSYNYPMGDGYEDYYNYVQWTYGNTVSAPSYFGFAGPGPSVQTSISSIILGTVFSVFSQGGTSGPPHHLFVVHDTDIVRTDLCGQVQKLIDFLIVDNHHPARAAGRVYIDEKPQSVTDSCYAGSVTLALCNDDVSRYGNFRDGIKTGCPHTGPSNCGFDFFNRWRWCGPGCSNTQDLAWMYYWATRTVIKVDNQSDMEDGSEKYP